MPMPREEDDDLFHDEDEVDFDDEDASEEASDEEDEESEAKTKKKKTAKKKSAKKKTPKKKAAKKSPKKKAKAAPKRDAEDDGFGAGLDLEDSNGEAEEPEKESASDEAAEADEPATDAEGDAAGDEYGRPEPQTDHAVHLYELGRLKRTFDREFTAEEAHAFADRYSKVSKNYGRKAVAGKKDTQPAKVID